MLEAHSKDLILVLFGLVILLAVFLRWLARRPASKPAQLARLLLTSLLPAFAYAFAVAASQQFLKVTELPPYPGYLTIALYGGIPFALLVALFPERLRGVGFGFVLTLFTLIVAGDLVYFRQFGNILPFLAAKSGGQIWDVRDLVIDSFSREDYWLLPLLLSAVIVAVCSWRLPKLAWRWPGPALQLALIAVGVFCSVPLYHDAQRWLKSQRSWRVYNGMDSVRGAGLVPAHLREAVRSWREVSQDQPLEPGQVAELQRRYDERAKAAEPGAGFGAARGKNVLMVQVEAMQEFVIGAQLDGQPITPFLNRLQERGLYFANIYDQTAESSTSDSEYLSLNSQHPLQQGAVAFRVAHHDFVALPHVFAEAGYSALSAHAYLRGMWNRAFIHPRWGFERSLFKEEMGEGKVYGWGLADHVFFERMVPVLASQARPWFAFLITLTSHGPYNYLPAKERKLKLGGLNGTQLGHYVQSMNYVDRALERFMTELEARGVLEHTVVAIYGDHDSRMMFKPADVRGAVSELGLSPERVDRLKRRDFAADRIPLFIVLPKGTSVPAGVVSTFGGQIDTAPTLLHFAGLPRPRSFVGKSLYPERPGSAVTVKGSGASESALWIADRQTCEKPDSFEALPVEQCAALKQLVAQELEMSWMLTTKNLARGIAGGSAKP